jgi:hypothetical protein
MSGEASALPPTAPPTAAVGTGQVFRLTVTQVTSMIVVTQRKSRVFTGSLEELEAGYRNVLTHNLLLGWWGFPFGMVWTVMALSRNRKARGELRALAQASAGPGA